MLHRRICELYSLYTCIIYELSFIFMKFISRNELYNSRKYCLMFKTKTFCLDVFQYFSWNNRLLFKTILSITVQQNKVVFLKLFGRHRKTSKGSTTKHVCNIIKFIILFQTSIVENLKCLVN